MTSPFRESLLSELGIHGFRVDDILGRGAFGIVYKIENLSLPGIFVALKLLSAGDKIDAAMAEIKLTQSVDSKHVVKVHNAVKLDHIVRVDTLSVDLYVTMEYVSGKTLQEFIDDKEATPELAVDIAYGLVNGLDACHKACIAHQDIKAENIIMASNKTAVLIDFGLACLTCDRSYNGDCQACSLYQESSYRCELNGILGTPEFWSPSKAHAFINHQRPLFDHQKDDVWALGMVLLSFALGKFPLECSGVACAQEIVSFYPEADILDVAGLPSALTVFLSMMLQKDEGDRLTTAELLDAFSSLGAR